MPLLGGACKMSAGIASGAPAFVSSPYTVIDFRLAPLLACAKLELRSNGELWGVRCGLASFQVGRWDNGLGTLTIGDYDFRVDKVSGADLNSDLSQNTWHAGVNLMKFGVEQANGTIQFTGTIRVRPSGGGADLDSATVTSLLAESTP